MNDESDLLSNTRPVGDSADTLLNTLNSQEGIGGSCPESDSSEFILNVTETTDDDDNLKNPEPEVLFNQGSQEDGEGSQEFELPSTAIVLHTNWGSKVYVVGTAHFSIQSQEDVAKVKTLDFRNKHLMLIIKVISAVQPNSVVLELCPSRSYMLTWDEEKMDKAKNLDFKTMRESIKTYGVFHGIVQLLLLSMSCQITREMGMAPGGEFRRAFKDSLTIPGCVVFLGDRPIEITLRRAFASMSWWETIKFAYSVMFSKTEFNKEEIEKCKNRDYLGNMLEMFAGDFPGLKEVFVNERDLYLTYSLVNAAMMTPKDNYPKTVVGVVGMGHLSGIQRNWESGKVDVSDIQRILKIPPLTRTFKLVRFTVKVSFYGLAIYGLHKLASRTRFYPPSIRLPFFGP